MSEGARQIRYRMVSSDEHHTKVKRLPYQILCLLCSPSYIGAGRTRIDLVCPCVGTQVEPIPFSEVWGI